MRSTDPLLWLCRLGWDLGTSMVFGTFRFLGRPGFWEVLVFANDRVCGRPGFWDVRVFGTSGFLGRPGFCRLLGF